ncbi:MAG: hypothetical protein SGI83_17780 [Bacteroidota bacterium]|nr:hypothetical protein [Bacteroidota bacterium]
MLFCITKEQVKNIIRHTQARSKLIRLQSDAEYILLTIADNGIGFNPGPFQKRIVYQQYHQPGWPFLMAK